MEQRETKTKASSNSQSISKKCKCQKIFTVNTAILILGLAMSTSGLLIQCYYHLLKNPSESTAFALNRPQWNSIHVYTSIGFLVAVLYHIWAHRKWYKNVLKKGATSKNRPTIILTLLAFIVVVSGLIPLLMLYFGGNSNLRFLIIEIHDKVAILFFIIVFAHTRKRFKWYFK